ncbi:hypothetical protein IAR55_000957 [Kwoniella newhampshirensis]|uniref:Vacuolar membrane protein n=1 Tax=Kwoniella newhampshirensis TaxID=1651941 RepID=A0AAW0Z4A4_9TREE
MADTDRCKLLGTTGLIVQGLMGIFVIISLVIKKHLERRKRSWRIWIWDVGKQLVGQALVHGLNVLISDVVARVVHSNPCSLYFLNVLIDTTLGVGILYFCLKGFTWVFTKRLGWEGFVSGQYGRPPRPSFWWKQLLPYLSSILIMKLLVLLPLTLPVISDLLFQFGQSLLGWLSPRIQVIFVMAIFPLIMNVFQFCLVDQVIKGPKNPDDETGEGRGGDREYSRLPTWEGDVERGVPDETTTARRRRPSALAKERENGSVPIPSSPLLSPSGYEGYGSTSPSPVGSPTKTAANGLAADDNIWSKIMNSKRDKAGGSTEPTSSSPYDDDEEELNGEPLLEVRRDDRRARSTAPSPDSMRPDGDLEPPSPVDTLDRSARTESSGMSETTRRLTTEAEREARWTLSPPESPTVGSVREERDQVGLVDVVVTRDR